MITNINKIKTIPSEIKSFLDSLKASELNLLILKRNNLNMSYIGSLLDIVSALFTKDLKVIDLPNQIIRDFKVDALAAKLLACDIVGLRLFVIKDWLNEDLNALIVSWGGTPQDYISYTEEEKKALEEEKKYFAEQSTPEPGVSFTPKVSPIEDKDLNLDLKKEKIDAPEIFNKNLVSIFSDEEGKEFISDYNDIIIALIAEDADFSQFLESALYSNQEKISTNNIIIEDKEVPPTISNWLKDFIKINGSEMFDELKMAEYLSASANAKKLTQSEKDLLRKLLKLYRNLAFFPDSMGNNPIEDWQIIPVDKVEINKKVSKPEVFQDALEDNKPIISKSLSVFPSSPAPAHLNTKKLEDIPLNELQEALTQYAPGSLEYKAVKQEIEHLKKKK